MSSPVASTYIRDRLTWLLYALLGWFAYLQATPGLVIGHLRRELGFDYTVGGLHVAAFAVGSTLAGLLAQRAERRLGRGRLLWSAAAVLSVGALGLVAGRAPAFTIAGILVMGVGGGLILVTVQAALADHHHDDNRTVALAEANVAASVAYVVLIGALSLVAASHLGWRVAVVASLVVPVLLWWVNRTTVVTAALPEHVVPGRLPARFWLAAAMLFCTTAAEWCITGWGATFTEQATGVATDTAVALMVGYFGGVVVGRALGSRLARRHAPQRLLAGALALNVVGFLALWPATTPVQALVGLTLLGVGIGNLFPMGISVAISLAPGQSGAASSRAVMVTGVAVILAPVTIGALADATSLATGLLVLPTVLAGAAVCLALLARRA
jgi:predicted MFS family arabinose efflux permease